MESPFFRTPEQRVALARERFFDHGERPRGLVGDGVIQSWERCLRIGLKPQQRPEFEPVTRARALRAVDRSRGLLQAAEPECRQLEATLAGTRCKALLTDRDGIVVAATASGGLAGTLLETAARVGVYLGEPNFGCTAPGVTTYTGAVSCVSGAEHFFGLLAPMHCAAAPVLDRQGRLAAVLDLSLEGQAFAFDALGLVQWTALAIEQRLFMAQSQHDTVLRLHLQPALLVSPLAGLLALDEEGRVLAMNTQAARLLGPPAGGPGDPSAEALLGLAAPALRQRVRHGQPERLQLPNGLAAWVQALRIGAHEAAAPAPAPPDPPLHAAPAPAGHPARLRDAQEDAIAAALARHQGNVSRTARSLGVSRGLVYRHLKRNAGG